MFKKNDMAQIKVEAIIQFFDLIAEQETFKSNVVNQDWLWRKLQFIIDFFNHNNLEIISQEKFIELVHAENHKLFFNEENDELTKSNVLSLNEAIEKEPLLKSLSHVLSAAWSIFYSNNYEKDKKEQFSKKHFFSIVNISMFSFILMGIFYAWRAFGAIALFGITAFFAYKYAKKFFTHFQNHREQKSIQKAVEKIIENKDGLSTKMIDDIGLEPWTNDREVNDELRNLKNKTLHFLSIYNKKEQNRDPSMVLDVERMWHESVPLFIEKMADNSSQKEVIINTLESMSNVLQKHIENLFWDDGFEVSVSQKYWLAKETGKNI